MGTKMTDLSKLTLEQLHQRLEELGAEWNAVEAQIERRTHEDKQALADLIRQKITDAGYRPEEITTLLRGRRGSSLGSRSYTTWIDPDSANTYVRGPLPAWLRDKMAKAGVDLADKEQREAFKQKHLKRISP